VRSGRGSRNEADGCLVIDGRALEYSTMFYLHSCLYRSDNDEAGNERISSLIPVRLEWHFYCIASKGGGTPIGSVGEMICCYEFYKSLSHL